MSVSSVGLNQNTYVPQQNVVQNSIATSASTNVASNVYKSNVGLIPQSTNTYDNDIMMQGIDFTQVAKDLGLIPQVPETANGETQQTPVQPIPAQAPQAQPLPEQTSFTGAVSEQGKQPQDDVQTDAKSDNKSSKIGATLGAVVGFATPFITNKVRLGKFLTKDLFIKAPVMTVAGLCLGGMSEGLLTSAKKLDEKNLQNKSSANVMDVKA